MLEFGEKVIVWDPDIQDMYTATAAQDEGDELCVNPLVRIVSLICYPIQHAVMAPDFASENAPIPEGTVCRLKLVCRGWLCFGQDYNTAIADARRQMLDGVLRRIERSSGGLMNLTGAAARAEYEILLRHEKGLHASRTLMGRDAVFTLRAGKTPQEVTGG